MYTSMGSSSNVNGTSSPREKYPCSTEFDVPDFVLSEGNYDSWKSSMRDFIDSQGLISFIDSTAAEQPKPSNRGDYMAWKRSDNRVQQWIFATLNEDTRIRVMHFKTAKDLWTALEKIFGATRSLRQRASSSNENSTSSPREKYPYPTEYFNVLAFVPKLLSEGNYEIWKKLMWDFIHMQGLIGFIEGTAVEKSNRDEAWNRSNNLVRGWILATLSEDTRLRVLSSKKMWTSLEIIFDATRAIWQIDDIMEYRRGHYLPLQKAITNGEWDKAMGIIEEEPDAVRTPIAPFSLTALVYAVTSTTSKGRDRFVRQLLERMTPQEVVDLVDDARKTALHHAAISDNTEGAKMLVNKNSNLPNVVDHHGYTPLHWAARFGSCETVRYLKEVTREDILLVDDMGAAKLLSFLTRAELYDIALTWLRRNPKMACVQVTDFGTYFGTPFDILAEKHSSFPSANCFNFWQRLIYSGVPVKSEGIANHRNEGGGRGDIENPVAANCCVSVRQRLHFMIWEVAEKLVPYVKRIREIKERQHHALELVKFLCMEVAKSKLSEVERIFKPALRIAVCVGIPEIIEEIVASYPWAMSFVILDNLNIFIYAIMYRRERVFNLLYDSGRDLSYINGTDNCLHVVARLRHEQQINLKASVAGAVLQMQREVQWFKEVEKFARPGDKEKRNRDGMTPAEVFSDTHQGLVKEGEQWMKDTATSCTIVFVVAITVPGGNNNENGHPLLSKQKAFIIFGTSDALALFSSITSVLMFLLILTSRYAEEDFLYTLPKRLIIGLITLFVSILSTMVAFGAILYLVFGDNKAWILIPDVALASIPVTLFGALQFPLLVDMIQSTYGGGIFGKKSYRVL